MFCGVVSGLGHLNTFLFLGHHEVKSILTCSHLCDILSCLMPRVAEPSVDRVGLPWTKTSESVRQQIFPLLWVILL